MNLLKLYWIMKFSMNKRKIKKITEKYFPPFLLDFFITIIFYFKYLFFSEKKILKNNKKLKNSGSNKRAFLLATGPSIKRQNLKLLAGEDCYSVSNFFLHDDINIVNPKIHFFAPYHEPLVLENYVNWLIQADKTLPKDTKIFLGHTTKKIVDKFSLFSNREVFYIYLTKVKPNKLFSIDLTGPIMGPQTGPLMILPVLLYMGYKEIFLVGCDHTVLRDYRKTINNFYNNQSDIRVNATDENSWHGIIDSHKQSMNVFVQYEMYKKIAESKNIKIINLSDDSWVDFFEKRDFNNSFGKI